MSENQIPPADLPNSESFGLTQMIIGPKSFLPLSADEAHLFEKYIRINLEALSVEQKFDILMRNFVELETELSSRTIHQAYRSEDISIEIIEDKQEINRRIINLLTSVRLYTDQIKHHAKIIFKENHQKLESIISSISAEYDKHLSYRIMEALRNFSQHRGLPLQGLSHQTKWVEAEESPRLEFNMAININIKTLEEDGDFKKSVLNELKEINNTIDIKNHIRKYVECLGSIHKKFREETKSILEDSFSYLDAKILLYKNKSPSEHSEIALALVKGTPEHIIEAIAYYSKERRQQLISLQKRYRSQSKLSQRAITTKEIKIT